jgi:hypothetical protein
MLNLKLTMREWARRLLTEDDPKVTVEEAALVEASEMNRHLTKIEAAMTKQAEMLDRVAYALNRLYGQGEREEIWRSRRDPAYPLAQLEAPEYRVYLREVKEYEAARQLPE